jgi:hypothetical protein
MSEEEQIDLLIKSKIKFASDSWTTVKFCTSALTASTITFRILQAIYHTPDVAIPCFAALSLLAVADKHFTGGCENALSALGVVSLCTGIGSPSSWVLKAATGAAVNLTFGYESFIGASILSLSRHPTANPLLSTTFFYGMCKLWNSAMTYITTNLIPIGEDLAYFYVHQISIQSRQVATTLLSPRNNGGSLYNYSSGYFWTSALNKAEAKIENAQHYTNPLIGTLTESVKENVEKLRSNTSLASLPYNAGVMALGSFSTLYSFVGDSDKFKAIRTTSKYLWDKLNHALPLTASESKATSIGLGG